MKGLRESMLQFERDYWLEVLRVTGGNVSAAAKIAGIFRTHAHKKLRRLGVMNPCRPPNHRGRWID